MTELPHESFDGRAPEPRQPTSVSPMAARPERDAMAWPPAAWERAPGSWRDDLDYPEPLVPYVPSSAPTRRRGVGSAGPIAREAVETVLLTVLMFVGIRLVAQNFRIDGQSMLPTLQHDQYLLVNKVSYNLFGEPQRGDVVVFHAWGQGKDFIKRVVGRPHDTIEFRNGEGLFVNGVRLEEPYIEGETSGPDGVITLGADEYYVLGDNRQNSSDSRQYGPLPAEDIIGKAWLTYWPPESIGPIPSNSTSFASSP
jgi:signal peptidase I